MLCLFGEKSWVGPEPFLSYYSLISFLRNDRMLIFIKKGTISHRVAESAGE